MDRHIASYRVATPPNQPPKQALDLGGPKQQPRPEGAAAPPPRTKGPEPTPEVAPTPPQPEPIPQTCQFLSPEERNAMHP